MLMHGPRHDLTPTVMDSHRSDVVFESVLSCSGKEGTTKKVRGFVVGTTMGLINQPQRGEDC